MTFHANYLLGDNLHGILEVICMKCRIMFYRKYKKYDNNNNKYDLLKFLLSMLSIKTLEEKNTTPPITHKKQLKNTIYMYSINLGPVVQS